MPLQDSTPALPPAGRLDGAEHGADGLVEDSLEALLGEGRALEVFGGTNLLSHGQTLRVRNGRELFVLEFVYSLAVFPQIKLGAHEDDGRVGAVVPYLRIPLCPDVLKAGRVDEGEADEEHVSLWVGEWTQAVVILLSRCIPEPQVDRLPIHHHIGGVVVEYCGDVLSGEGICRVADEETCFTHGSVAHHHTLDGLHNPALMAVTRTTRDHLFEGAQRRGRGVEIGRAHV